MASNSRGSSSAPTTNAWSKPFQQRNRGATTSDPLAPPPGIGVGPGKKGDPAGMEDQELESTAASKMNGMSLQSVLRERFVKLSLSMVGQRVVVAQSDGGVIEGVLHTFTPFASQPPHMRNKYVVKSCKHVVKGSVSGSEESGLEPISDGSTVIIPTELVSSVHVKSMRLDTGLTNGNPQVSSAQHEHKKPRSAGSREMLRTDAEISAGKGGQDRDLVAAGSAWTSSSSNNRADQLIGLLDDKGVAGGGKGLGSSVGVSSSLRGSIGEWDQFKANEDLFDVRASFDENLYTTELDKSQIDHVEQRKAERLAKEIENAASSNIHIAEERGHIVQGDYDEEDKYSGVLARSSTIANKNKGGFPVENDDRAEKQMKVTENVNGTPSSIPAPSHAIAPAGTKMNYAAAAAKADVRSAGKVSPPGFGGETKASVPDSLSSGSSGSPPSGAKSVGGKENSPVPTPTAERKAEADEPSLRSSEYNEERTASVSSDGAPAESEESIAMFEEGKGENMAGTETDPIESKNDRSEEVSLEEVGKGTDEKDEVTENKSSSDGYSRKVSSKLNANAKAFTFNPDAKSFTPGTGTPDPHVVEPNPLAGAPPMQTQQPQFVQFPTQMSQSGMIPMMSAHLSATMRYQGASHPYPGIDQHAPPLQPHQHPQHTQQMQSPQVQEGGSSSTAPGSGEDSTTQQHGQQSQPGRTPQRQSVPMPYNVPPAGAAAYFSGGMSLHPHQRVPAAAQFGGSFHHQLPQQMPVVPGTTPYRHIYGPPTNSQQPSGVPGVAQMHFPGGGSPYCPSPGSAVVPGGMHYPPGSYVGPSSGPMEDGAEAEFRGGTGRGTARGVGVRGGKRNSRKSGRGGGGRGSYNTNQNVHHQGVGSGRQSLHTGNMRIASSTLEGPDQSKFQNSSGESGSRDEKPPERQTEEPNIS